MLSIQEAGKQILSDNPGKFYVFGGEEYGVKDKYLSIIKKHYNGDFVEVESMEEIFTLMRTKHLIPLSPKLYITRYDEEYISNLGASSVSTIKSMKIIGSIVLICQSPKHTAKCGKFLPDYTIAFDPINTEFIKKYLSKDFPNLPNTLVEYAVTARPDYKAASNICNCLQHLDPIAQNNLSLESVSFTFGCNPTSTEAQFKLGIASRNFAYCLSILESYNGDVNTLFYSILSTLIELEKLLGSTYSQSPFHKYVKAWSPADIYYMFMHTYEELRKSRNYASYDVTDSIIYLLGMLQFNSIPSMEVMGT